MVSVRKVYLIILSHFLLDTIGKRGLTGWLPKSANGIKQSLCVTLRKLTRQQFPDQQAKHVLHLFISKYLCEQRNSDAAAFVAAFLGHP